jgi:hypothetical protein
MAEHVRFPGEHWRVSKTLPDINAGLVDYRKQRDSAAGDLT